MELKGKVAVITGATSGIGAAVARNLSEAGVRTVIAGRREELLESLAKELGESEAVARDIADPAMPDRLIQQALDSFGRCDFVFNNAGLMTSGDISTIDLDYVCNMVRVTVEAAYRMIYTALRHFKKVGSGYLMR